MKHLEESTAVSTPLLDLKTSLEASGSVESNMQILEVGGNRGKGHISNLDFSNGMSVMKYDLKLYNDFSFSLFDSDINQLYFLYAVEGEFYHNFEGSEKQILIEELRTTIVVGKKNTKCNINLRKNINYSFSIISIDKDTYFDNLQQRYNTPEEDLNRLYDALDVIENKVYKCACNLKVADQLRLLDSTKVEFNITNLQYFEGHFQIILAQHLKQFCNEAYGERVLTPLSKTELQKIRKITDYIIDNPMLQHTIKNLCDRLLLSPAKLQEGFKCMHKTTVSNYIKNVRVEKSRDLLIYTDYNVSEISYMVGFTSRSYFCKIFKERYGFNATAYRAKYKEKGINFTKL